MRDDLNVRCEGALANESTFRLFALAAATRASGRLTLALKGRSYALTFRRGVVEHVASSDPDDGVAAFLVRKGAIGQDALARAQQRQPAMGGDLVSALIAERLVNPADIATLLQEHGTQLVQRALKGDDGTWSWDPQAPAPAGGFPLGAPFAMLSAAARSLDAATVARRLGGRGRSAAARTAGRVSIEELRLNAQETRALGLFDGSRSAAEIAAANPRDEAVVMRLALLLGDLELLELRATRQESPGAAATAPSSGPIRATAAPAQTGQQAGAPAPRSTQRIVAPGQRPAVASGSAAQVASRSQRTTVTSVSPVRRNVATAGSSISRPTSTGTAQVPRPAPGAPPAPATASPIALDRASLESLCARLAGADHFTVLGVKQDAPAPQIKIAYFQLAKLYHPDAVPPDAPQDVRKLCADVFAKVSEAWAALGSDASRAAYLETLRSGGSAEVDVKSILDAESAFREGTLLVKARRYAEALERFAEALKLNPDEAEFGMWTAWCEFLVSPEKKRTMATASSAIEAGLKKNPRCATGYLFLGQMAKLVGDVSLAERQLRRGLEVAPRDADLQRELRYLCR